MKREPTIAEVLHRAAECHLSPDGSDRWGPRGWMARYSCSSVEEAVHHLEVDEELSIKIRKGLRNMGVDVESYAEFDEFKEGPERQAARYMWLKFSAMIAEEQGV